MPLAPHSWSDVAYVVALVILAIVNAYAHKAINARAKEAQTQADLVHSEIVDVKRATGVDKRETDTAPVPIEPASAPPPGTPARRRTDSETTDTT